MKRIYITYTIEKEFKMKLDDELVKELQEIADDTFNGNFKEAVRSYLEDGEIIIEDDNEGEIDFSTDLDVDLVSIDVLDN